MCTEILRHLGHQVSVAYDGEQGLNAVKLGVDKFDLVLMDCDMPIMNGFEATRAIREWESEQGRTSSIPIIALTAHAMNGDKQRCFEAGMDDYITKPIILSVASCPEALGLLRTAVCCCVLLRAALAPPGRGTNNAKACADARPTISRPRCVWRRQRRLVVPVLVEAFARRTPSPPRRFCATSCRRIACTIARQMEER